ncbi:DUF378 domain-containing protein [Candidatus Peregrinibacteria bacterium]|nr:DUF378 domain-containing protein [Candidatus Peregrinibacteria bacterium]
MMKHKPMCMLVNLLVLVGAVNWGLAGLGMLIGQNLNLVNRILGSWPTVEAIVYLLVGLAGLAMGAMFVSMKDCACEKMSK